MTTHSISLAADKQVDLTVTEYGSGSPILLLHGGAGPQSMTGFAQRLATEDRAHVYVPNHPGFGGTTRPDWLTSIGALAQTYVALIEQLDLHDVTVIGNSIGGWIAAEIALCASDRISSFIIMDAVGIAVEGQSVADIFQLTMDEISKLSYYDPAPFRIDPAAMTDIQKAGMAANRQALAVYGGKMVDLTLRDRLGGINTPTLILWGDSDRIATADYGRAFAAAIPTATFQLLANTGHLPHIETPDQTLAAVWDFIDTLNIRRPTNG